MVEKYWVTGHWAFFISETKEYYFGGRNVNNNDEQFINRAGNYLEKEPIVHLFRGEAWQICGWVDIEVHFASWNYCCFLWAWSENLGKYLKTQRKAHIE